MNKKKLLIEITLNSHEIAHSGQIAEDIFDENHFYVFVEVGRDADNYQVPSNKKLNSIKETLVKAGLNIEFVLTDSTRRNVEDGLRASMLHSFPDVIRNAFLSMQGASAQVWLVPKVALSSENLGLIREKISLYLQLFDISDFSVDVTSTANLPSRLNCLQVIRINSPTNIDVLISKLRHKGFTIPSEDWMSRMLDVLRKHGLIIRSKQGLYYLSLEGIKALGTTKGRRSPDITRMLALNRTGE